jgi:hypothetical protein
MREEYNFDELNPRKNPYVGRLEELIDEAVLAVDDNFGIPNATQMAKYLAERGVVVKNDNALIEFVMPAKIGSLVWIADGRKIQYGVVEGYKITEHGSYCYGSISEPRDDDPEDRILVDNFGINVNDFGKTVFLQDKVSFEEVQKIINDIVPYDANSDETLCEGCLSNNCDFCPKDDGYKCRWCPCDTCKVVDGKRTNWYDSYTSRY